MAKGHPTNAQHQTLKTTCLSLELKMPHAVSQVIRSRCYPVGSDMIRMNLEDRITRLPPVHAANGQQTTAQHQTLKTRIMH